MKNKPYLPFALTAVASLSACAGGASDRYPSLAIRDAERVSGEFQPVDPPPPVEPIVSSGTLADILASARAFDSRFEAARPEALRLARRAGGAGPDSEARSRAMVAIADLMSLHGRTTLALGDLDRLEAEAAGAFAPLESIREAQAEVARLVATQEAALTAIEDTAR